MIDKSVARRYGKALFDIAGERNKATECREDLAFIVDTINSNDQLEVLITGRIMTTGEKKNLVKQVFGEYVSVETLNLLYIVIDKGRETCLEQILTEYVKFMDEAAGIIPVNVTAAISLDKQQMDSLGKAFQDKLENPVRLVVSEDKALIGGLKVQIGDTVYDGSIASQLASLQKQLCK